MRKRYIIGFFAAFFVFVLMLTAGYQITYERVARRQAASNESADTRSITAEGEAVKDEQESEDEGYYLCELQGFVVVYLSDKKTVYEFTEIPLIDLPEEVQQEIASGKYVAGEEELYGFLENYSS